MNIVLLLVGLITVLALLFPNVRLPNAKADENPQAWTCFDTKTAKGDVRVCERPLFKEKR